MTSQPGLKDGPQSGLGESVEGLPDRAKGARPCRESGARRDVAVTGVTSLKTCHRSDPFRHGA